MMRSELTLLQNSPIVNWYTQTGQSVFVYSEEIFIEGIGFPISFQRV